MTPVSASMQDQMADGSLSPVYVIRMHFWENANERQVSRLTRRVKAGHGCLQGGQPDNAGETDEATDGKIPTRAARSLADRLTVQNNGMGMM